jgi:hypothetical protein
MFKIKKNGVVTNAGPNQEWLDEHVAMGTFGCPASQNEDGTWNPAEYSIEWDESIPQDQINAEARRYLAETDWMIVRALETGVQVPDEVLDQRKFARTRII